MITTEQITLQVFEAIEEGKFLPIGKRLSLDYFNSDMDGIFETLKAWKAFINGNFLSDYSKDHWRESIKDSTIKKHCYSSSEYKDRFVVKVGQDKYIQVSSEEIELEYDYELFYRKDSDFPSSVELYVKANIK